MECGSTSSDMAIKPKTLHIEPSQDLSTNTRPTTDIKSEDKKPPIQYFHCSICNLKEKFDYFGCNPPFVKHYKLLENAYCVEDPFSPPKQGEVLVLGSHCEKCNCSVCKDSNCSFYYAGTYCIKCAKDNSKTFPSAVQEKLNRIIV